MPLPEARENVARGSEKKAGGPVFRKIAGTAISDVLSPMVVFMVALLAAALQLVPYGRLSRWEKTVGISLRRGLKRVWIPVILRVWPLARLWYGAWGLTLDGHPADAVWYFAYGANMHDSAFRARRGMRPDEWRVGRIIGYRLRFNLDGRPRGRAAPANISPDKEGEVWGVLYRISRRELVRLNASEGIPGWRYRPLWLAAEDINQNPLEAVTYIAHGKEEDGNPSLRYITLLREGARGHGLPAPWISFLESVAHAE